MVATASPAPVGNLSIGTTSFVGRRQERVEARRMLSGTRLLTLTGPGGVGKTRLAQQVADEVRRAFPDGVWFVDLTVLRDPELLGETVAATFGLRDDTTGPAARLAEYLADKRLLLVLDNCEHLLDECARLVGGLLPAAPGVRVLATSRHVLRVVGEQVLPVPPLPVPEPRSVDGAESSDDAVALFADRAARVLPGFEVTSTNRATVVHICRQLDGIPLAIELAAVRLRSLPLDTLRAKLADRFHVLATGDRAVAPRQRTLAAAIDWGFELCSPQERLLWARLSVFAGGFDLEAAEEVCSGDGIDRGEVLDLLAGLVEKSIVTHQDPNGRRSRYAMLETLRQYGRQKLAAGGAEAAIRARHRDHYQRLAEQVRTEYFSPRETEWFAQLRSEHANLRVALEFCLREPGQARGALQIAAHLRGYWIAEGCLREGVRWLRQALALDTEPSVSRLRALWSCGFLALLLGYRDTPLEMLAEAEALAHRLNHPRSFADLAWVTGVARYFHGHKEESFRLQREALEQYRKLGDDAGASNALLHMAIAAFVNDDPRAAELGAESLAICDAHGAQWSKAYPLWIVGMTAWRDGDHGRAIDLLQEAVERFRTVRDLTGISLCLHGLAWAAGASGRHAWAARLLGATQPIWRLSGAAMPREAIRGIFDERCVAAGRAALGRDTFDAGYAEGSGYGEDAAVACALERPAGDPEHRDRRDATEPAGPADPAARLTRREWEIAELVAQGLSTRKIAERLVIAPRTVDTHVENMLTKLGFNSRARIAAWVSQQEAEPGVR
ncbi:LuxR C-terminal-related transcriptional regulator [Gandjariella thermophila]|uniref:LuxR family transcriptional regulator n=1 Tax=Gandjariella thermophila TaxID=1931992 RepID=A0A4D4J7B8_9PSEU|nr:LuxR C-terminal-related transcriptional regulator [Gandjariella thermophila]GDY31082.1 LuxR family transcriptional regulator [Gandjariella thermophila]